MHGVASGFVAAKRRAVLIAEPSFSTNCLEERKKDAEGVCGEGVWVVGAVR